MSRREPFDAALQDWVSVQAASYFFEPYCTEFRPKADGQVLLLFGRGADRLRGIDVILGEDGTASIWVPPGGRAFWLPALPDASRRNEPWETRLRELDHESGGHIGS